jgi:hypothetical protein
VRGALATATNQKLKEKTRIPKTAMRLPSAHGAPDHPRHRALRSSKRDNKKGSAAALPFVFQG